MQKASRVIAPDIVDAIVNYFGAARKAGVNVLGGALYGSYARGEQREFSDLDVVVFVDNATMANEREMVGLLWRLRARTDSRIEPVMTTYDEWHSRECRPIIAAARQDAVEIDFPGLNQKMAVGA